MKKAMTMMLSAALGITLMTGCQATPQRGVVVRKDLQQMLKLAAGEQEKQGSLDAALNVPKEYKTRLEDEKANTRVIVDASVSLPDTQAIPIVRVKALPFEQETVDRVLEVLMGGRTLYDIDALMELTKSEIQDRLTALKLSKADLERQGMKPESQEDQAAAVVQGENQEFSVSTRNSNQLDSVLDAIARLEKQLVDAPEEKQLKETTGSLVSQDLSDMPKERQKEYAGKRFELARAAVLNPLGGLASLFVVNNQRSNNYYLQYVNRGDYDSNSGGYSLETDWNSSDGEEAEAKALKEPAITEEQARATAESFIKELGLNDFFLAQIEKVIGGSSTYQGDLRLGNLVKGYQLEYTRRVAGVPITHTDTQAAGYLENNSYWMWTYEALTFVVNDDGIVELVWEAPYQMGETLVEDAVLLPFDKIQQVFEKMILVKNSEDKEQVSDITITQVRLGLARITEQNSLTSGLLVPVWDFFGTRTDYYESDGNTYSHTEAKSNKSYLTINAIDGTIIDRGTGY